jgi:hypothetical protein
MRRLVWLTAIFVTLAAAGAAVATHGFGTRAVKSVTATFSATSVSNSSVATCTTAEGTLEQTHATYSGSSSSSEPSLNGTLTAQLTTVVNKTTNVGTVAGSLRIRQSGPDTFVGFTGTYANGQVNGLAAGGARSPYNRLIANVSAAFNPASGLTNGKIGATDGNGAAILVQPGRCQRVVLPKQKVDARGTVTAVSSTSITVAGVTCAVPASLAGKVAEIKVNDQAAIRCELVDSVLTLTTLGKVEKKKDDDKHDN